MGIKVNSVLKMDNKGRTALLSAILIGMAVILVPAITERALAVVHATATGTCGPPTGVHSCMFTFVSKKLINGNWNSNPTPSGTLVTWSTTGGKAGVWFGGFGSEEGSVTYNVGEAPNNQTAVLYFYNPLVGQNGCSVSGMPGTCVAGPGSYSEFSYNLRGK